MFSQIRSWMRFQSWPLALKLTVVFAALFATVIVSLGVSSYISSERAMRREIQQFVPQTLVQVNLHLDTYVAQMISIAQEILKTPYSDYFHEFESVWAQEGRKPTINNSLLLNRAIQYVSRGYDNRLLGIIYYSSDGYAYVRGRSGGGSWMELDYRREPWYADNARLRLWITGTRREVLFEKERPNLAPYAFTIMQQVPGQGKDEISGIVQISGDLGALGDILSGMDMGADSQVYVIDERASIVYADDASLLGQRWDAAYGLALSDVSGASGSRVAKLHGSRRLVSYSRSEQTGWTVVSTIPLSNLTRGIRETGERTMLVVLAALLLSAVAVRTIAYGITQPLRYLSRQLDKLDEDNLHVIRRSDRRFDRRDEVGLLWHAYERMVTRIRMLVQELLKGKLLKQELEIRALRSQINPHFLNNALESIRMTMVRGRYAQAESALVSLGDLMRYQCTRHDDKVPAAREIELVRNWLQLQQLRFGDRLIAECEIGPDVDGLLVPSFLIQPLVENAVKYGASPDDGCIRIFVTIRREGGQLVGSVVDEGEGMEPEQLDRVVELMRDSGGGEGRIGLSNIYERLQLLYGDLAQLRIDSSPGAGTLVAFRLPAERAAGEEESGDEHRDRR